MGFSPVGRQLQILWQGIRPLTTPWTCTSQITPSVQPTITLIGLGARLLIQPPQIHPIPSPQSRPRPRPSPPMLRGNKQNMPYIRQNPPSNPIIRRGRSPSPRRTSPHPIKQPLPQRNILPPRMSPDILPRDNKLRTALRPHRIVAPQRRSKIPLPVVPTKQHP
jgi:hypothetical protein